MLDAHTIRAMFLGGTKLGAKGVALIAGVVFAQWLAFGDVQADHTAQLADHETRIRAVETRNDARDLEYSRDRAAWLWRECLDLYRAGHPIPKHMAAECAAVYRELKLQKEPFGEKPNS